MDSSTPQAPQEEDVPQIMQSEDESNHSKSFLLILGVITVVVLLVICVVIVVVSQKKREVENTLVELQEERMLTKDEVRQYREALPRETTFIPVEDVMPISEDTPPITPLSQEELAIIEKDGYESLSHTPVASPEPDPEVEEEEGDEYDPDTVVTAEDTPYTGDVITPLSDEDIAALITQDMLQDATEQGGYATGIVGGVATADPLATAELRETQIAGLVFALFIDEGYFVLYHDATKQQYRIELTDESRLYLDGNRAPFDALEIADLITVEGKSRGGDALIEADTVTLTGRLDDVPVTS